MNANELRIGNLVWACGDAAVILTIEEEVCKVRFLVDVEGRPLESVIDIEDIEPITLTEDWLEDFGFEYNKVFYRHKSGLSLIGLKDLNLIESIELAEIRDVFNTVAWRFSSVVINGINPIFKHVHQLQNLYFALTGEELQIKQPA